MMTFNTARGYSPFQAGSWAYPEFGATTEDIGCAHRHNEGANFGFCDGHAKWMSKASVVDGAQAWYNAGAPLQDFRSLTETQFFSYFDSSTPGYDQIMNDGRMWGVYGGTNLP